MTDAESSQLIPQEFIDLLHSMHGQRFTVAEAMLRKGQTEQAYKYSGQASALRSVISTAEHLNEEGELPDTLPEEKREAYRETSEALQAANSVPVESPEEELKETRYHG